MHFIFTPRFQIAERCNLMKKCHHFRGTIMRKGRIERDIDICPKDKGIGK